jgi:membrane protein DedA with SNARE-associated domain
MVALFIHPLMLKGLGFIAQYNIWFWVASRIGETLLRKKNKIIPTNSIVKLQHSHPHFSKRMQKFLIFSF